jgi:quercetin dioxygenase-like cupin family protein
MSLPPRGLPACDLANLSRDCGVAVVFLKGKSHSANWEENMRTLLSSTAFILLGGLTAEGSELPSFEKLGFPITPTQVSVLGAADVRESSSVPTLTFGGMPASPHQIRVLTPSRKITDPVTIASTNVGDLTAIRSLLPADHPEGVKATVTLVSLKRAPNMHDVKLATFIVDYEPGGSAVLHRTPASGYVLVYVLSGAIRAKAWGAGVGTYREGQSWVYPAFAYNITGKNASTDQPARALVVLVMSDNGPREFKGDLVSARGQDIAAAIGR